jgi:hypothetical protein
MNKKTWIAVIIVALVVLVWWMVSADRAAAPADDLSVVAGGEAGYSQELDGLQESDLNAEFQASDKNLEQL